jgi:ABC-type uncharacterized transport system auxiliary subunit
MSDQMHWQSRVQHLWKQVVVALRVKSHKHGGLSCRQHQLVVATDFEVEKRIDSSHPFSQQSQNFAVIEINSELFDGIDLRARAREYR